MLAVFSLLTIVALSLLVTKIATMALIHTGLSRESARFQARSAFTGAGFTTQESENVVRHPVRRRIIMLLMLLGNAGFVTAIGSLILTFLGEQRAVSNVSRAAVLAVGATLLWWLAASRLVDRYLSRAIDRALRRWTRLDVTDYAALFHLAGEYRIAELQVGTDDWLEDRSLAGLELNREGILVLGIDRRDGSYLGAPRGATRVHTGDTLILYGRASALAELDERGRGLAGDEAHRRAVAEQERMTGEEEREGKPLSPDPDGDAPPPTTPAQ